MPNLLDLVYVALFAAIMPLWEYLVSWRSIDERIKADPVRFRKQMWIEAIGWQWATVAVGSALWLYHGRPWANLGLTLPESWRLWVSVGLILILTAYNVQAASAVVRDPKTRASMYQQFTGKIADVMPHTRAEMRWFTAVSLTAGFCEEFLFRGFFLWALSPWLGWWGAAALSLAIFAGGHAYQGWPGVVRTGIVGVVFTLAVAIFGSLWPAIVLHAVLDVGMGMIAFLAIREGSPCQIENPR